MSGAGVASLWFVAPLVVVALIILLGSVFTIETAHAGIVQRLGKFLRIAPPGLNFKMPFIDNVVRRLSLQVEQLDVKVETKTKDNVFIQIPISVQYRVDPDKVYDAFYKLSDPRSRCANSATTSSSRSSLTSCPMTRSKLR